MTRLLGRYEIEEKLGHGSFGRVYRAIDIQTGIKYAIKVEKVSDKRNTMKRELEIYKHINGEMKYIPKIICYGRGDVHTDAKTGVKYFHQYLVMELLGTSLSTMRENRGGSVSWKTLARIAMQSITLLQEFHSQGYVHRDIKPDNFVLGLGDKTGIVYMLDFGLSRRWEDLIDKYTQNDESSSSSSIVGTARYMSINIHYGKVYGWRDDMESLGYVLIYMLTGSLPWQGLKAPTKRLQMKNILKIKEKSKKTLSLALPPALSKYMQYCWTLELGTQPDYQFLWELFHGTLVV